MSNKLFLKKMEIADIQQRLRDLPHDIQKAGEKYAEDKADLEFKEDMKKAVLAKRMMEVAKSFKEKKENASEWKIRFIAEADDVYTMFLEELRASRERSLKSQVRYN